MVVVAGETKRGPRSVAVRLLLQGGHEYRFECARTDSVLRTLSSALERLANGTPNSGLLSLRITENDQVRGLDLPAASIVAIETDPPMEWVSAEPGTIDIETAPYIRIPNFLPADRQDALIAFVRNHEQDFTGSAVETGVVGHRDSRVIVEPAEIAAAFRALIDEIAEDVLREFHMPIAPDRDIEVQLTAHNEGGYYKLHNDNGTPRTANRLLTYLYYFHREPPGFGGGHLRLYDSIPSGDAWLPTNTHTNIRPENNMLVMFPSRVFHEVLPVDCPSGEFLNSRFTINGWVRDRSLATPP